MLELGWSALGASFAKSYSGIVRGAMSGVRLMPAPRIISGITGSRIEESGFIQCL
jgi:hypothetical protein